MANKFISDLRGTKKGAFNLPSNATPGAPASGDYLKGDHYTDSVGDLYICKTSGTPGTWEKVSSTLKQSLFSFEGTLVTGAHPFRIYNFLPDKTISAVYISVGTAPTDASILVDIHKDGTTIFTNQANRPAITATNFTGNTTTIDVATWATNSYLTVEIDQIGSTIAGSNLVVYVVYY